MGGCPCQCWVHEKFLLGLICSLAFTGAAADRQIASKPPLKALFLTGGGYHDYQKLAPHLTNHLGALANVSFDVRFDMDLLKNERFADAYDVIV